MFLQSLFDQAMTGGMPIADYLRLALQLAETEQDFRVLAQVTGTLTASVHMLQRLRPDTNQELPRLLDDVEVMGLKQAHFAPTQDLKRHWFDLFLSVASSPAALGTSRALIDGRTDVEGLAMSQDLRWQLLTILSKGNAPGVPDLLLAEIAKDPSDLGQRSLLTAQAAAPDFANKERWVDELQSPATITNFSRQRAVVAQLFPATQTALQLQLLTRILSALPQMSRDADTYFLTSYTSALLRPMCTTESSALMQATLDEFGEELHPTVLKYLREAHQADVECETLRTVQ
jgi:aminopeptidase N